MQRLHHSHNIEHMFRSGKSRSTKGVQMRVLSNKHNIVRLGVIVPKKHIVQAVKRNKTKRLLREAWRSVVTTYGISGIDVLLIVVDKSHPRTFQDYRESLNYLYQTQFI